MAELTSNSTSKNLTKIYFGITLVCMFAEITTNTTLLLIFKPLLIPSLMVLYYYTSETKNIYYFASLFFALCSNVFLISSAQEFLLYGILAFMLYRILTIVIVLRLINRLPLLPFIIACLPFVFIFSCLINLTMNSLSTSFYPAIINAALLSALSGIALSNYVLDDGRTNSWLAIGTLLSVVLAYLFMIQKYYFANEVFQPISALIFACAHYAFYKFVVISEKQKSNETITP